VTIVIERRRGKRYAKVGTLTRASNLGANSVAFSGRILVKGRTRSLGSGRHRASLRATDASGNRSAVKRVAFRVVR
jgi:hypothetical protein